MPSSTHHEIVPSPRGSSDEPVGHGWREAVVTLFVTRRAKLLGACLRWTRGHSADAEDLLADACLRVLESARRPVTEVSAPVPFCMTVIANLARDRRRIGVRRATGASPPRVATEPPARELWPDEIFASRESLLSLTARFDQLPASQRRALVLRSLGRDYQEIAASLGTSPANAPKLVQLARFDIRRVPAIDQRRARGGLRCRTTCLSVTS